MKKDEKRKEIRKRSIEYAQSGEHSGWLSIEIQIRSEGFPEARRVLDDQFLREHLDSLCKTATSLEEIDNRQRFDRWLNQMMQESQPQIKERMPEISLSVHNAILLIQGPNFTVEVWRQFGYSKLQSEKIVDSKNGRRYRLPNGNVPTDTDFDKIVGNEAVDLILKLAKSGAVAAKNS